MKKMKGTQEHQGLKRKLMSSLAMLLVATILLSTTSYAWFILSTAPEVTGIDTQVGANGSLEIALLNTETYTDKSAIKSGLGSSLAEDDQSANNAWGNLVDLGYSSYGLGNLVLMPARLDATMGADGYTVSSGVLAVPSYGFDGRIVDLTNNTQTAIYQDTDFMFKAGSQDYGVRAIGTSDAMTPQGSGLAQAKSNITTYTKNTKTDTQAALTKNGPGLFDIVFEHVGGSDSYNDTHKDQLSGLVSDLDKVLDYIDLALRQGLVGYAASAIADETTYVAARDRIMDTNTTVSALVNTMTGIGAVPEQFKTWASRSDAMQNRLNASQQVLDGMTGGSYTWDQIKAVLANIMDMNSILIEGKTLSDPGLQDALMDKVGGVVTVTLANGSGLFADIADFAGNYSVTFAWLYGTNIQMNTVSVENPAYLVALGTVVDALTPAGGGVEAAALPLTSTYGYALDLAFRCNAAEPDLWLQTDGVQRVYNGSEDPNADPADINSSEGSTQGAGSYMEFASMDETFTLDQTLALMDAVRVGFLSDTGEILGIAKLRIYNSGGMADGYTVVDGRTRAPLYLYNYDLVKDDHGMMLEMKEIRNTDAQITTLEKNVAKAVTVVVWLDGDTVDNTMVSASKATSLDGVLNLQFATSAELIPAQDSTLIKYTVDKSGLETAVADAKLIADAGQGAYTSVSWRTFKLAYDRAVSVNNNDNAGAIEIRNALKALTAAQPLVTVSTEALSEKAAEIREKMGSIDGEIGSYVIQNADGTYSAVGNVEHTQEEHESWNIISQINKVDYESKNVNDEGNGILTNIYSDGSWTALEYALYQAEAVVQNPGASEAEVDAALSALDDADKALSRQVYFAPYEYKGDIYYRAKHIVSTEENPMDTYGRWYDSNYKRIFSEVTMMNLDAYAKPAVIAEVGQNAYVPVNAGFITPDIGFLKAVYPELENVQVKGVNWDAIDAAFFTELMTRTHYDKLVELVSMLESDTVLKYSSSEASTAALAEGKRIIARWDDESVTDVEAAAARAAIWALHDAITELYEINTEKMEAEGTAMTTNQRTLLTAAVAAANAFDGEAEAAKKNTLKAKADAAQALLDRTTEVTKDEANTALNELNTALKAVNAGEITEYNTLTHKLPVGFGSSDFVYFADYPGIALKLTGANGVTTLGATILSADGVVLKVSKEVTVFEEADGMALKNAEGEVTSLNLAVNGSQTLTAGLVYNDSTVAGRDQIKRATWTSSDTELFTVSASGVVSALKAGSGNLEVSVETEGGHTYQVTIPVTIQ